MGAVESCCKPGKFSAGSGSSHAGKAFTVADCDPCATVKDCAPCGTRGLKPEVEFVEYPAHIDPTQYLTSRFSVPKTLDSPLKSSMKKKALPTPVKSSVSFKGNIEQGQFLAQDDDSQFVRRRQAPRHLPPPPRLHDEHAEREHMIIWEQSRQAFQAMNPKVKYEEYMTHSKDDGVQRMRMQRMAENSADYYLEASKTYLTRMGGGPTIVKATSAKPLGHQRSGNLVASINPDHRFNEDEFYNELGEALQSTLRSDMPGKGVMHRPEPTSTQQWHTSAQLLSFDHEPRVAILPAKSKKYRPLPLFIFLFFLSEQQLHTPPSFFLEKWKISGS